MAVSTTTATTIFISQKNFHAPNLKSSGPNPSFSNSITFATKPRKISFVTRNSSADVSAETTTTEAAESETSIQAPPESSLISALNVERALRGIAITDADHYGTLGLQRKCSYDQVTVAYKNKVEEVMNEGLDEEETTKKMELLKESYSILSNEQERRLYDWSLARGENPDTYVWPYEADIAPPFKGTPPPQEPEDVGPTRLVGYFMLGWLILAFILSVALNQ